MSILAWAKHINANMQIKFVNFLLVDFISIYFYELAQRSKIPPGLTILLLNVAC